MADNDITSRNVRRLQTLEANLKSLRESSERLAAERSSLALRLEEAEQRAAKAEAEKSALEEQAQTAMAAFEELVDSGVLPKRVRRRRLVSYTQNVAKHIITMGERLATANERAAQFDEERRQLGAELSQRETLLRDALTTVGALQEQINTRVVESEQRAQKLESALAEARDRINLLQDDNQIVSQLIDENRQLATKIDEMNNDVGVLRNAAKEAAGQLDKTRQETEARVRQEMGRTITSIEKERDGLLSQLTTATKQLAAEGKTPMLPADKVADMLSNLVDNMQGNLGGLRIQDGEFKLKLAVGSIGGEDGGFLVPTPDATDVISDNLQEVTFRFNNTILGPDELE